MKYICLGIRAVSAAANVCLPVYILSWQMWFILHTDIISCNDIIKKVVNILFVDFYSHCVSGLIMFQKVVYLKELRFIHVSIFILMQLFQARKT